MPPSLDRRVAVLRRVLAELDRNRDLNSPRGQTKRAPIIFAQENEDAVLEGLRLGTYDANEVIAWTDYRAPPYAAFARAAGGSDNEVARPAAEAPGGGEASEGELAGGPEEDDDELLGEAMAEDFADDMVEDQEHEGHGESEEHIEGPIFDPTAIGLKEINNLAHFGVSSHKPGNGVEELLSEDLDKYWQ